MISITCYCEEKNKLAAPSNHELFEYYKRPEYTQVPINDILYFQSEGRKVSFYCSDKSYYDDDSFYLKLDEVSDKLKDKKCNFIRIHKSTLVNQTYISGFDRFNVRLVDGQLLKISKYEYYKNLKKILLHL